MTETEEKYVSIQPEWMKALPVQQQGVLFLATRGPDGVEKFHPCKAVVRAYRGTVMVAARVGRSLHWGEYSDTFMGLDRIANPAWWAEDCVAYFKHMDSLPLHYHLHLLHGAQILGYKHPEERMRRCWLAFYMEAVDDMHLSPESEPDMDVRLSDWFREEWDQA